MSKVASVQDIHDAITLLLHWAYGSRSRNLGVTQTGYSLAITVAGDGVSPEHLRAMADKLSYEWLPPGWSHKRLDI